MIRYLNYLIILIIIALVYIWWTTPVYITQGVARVAPENVKRAIWKMGPYYSYIMKGDKLYVDTGDGKWRRLRYDK